MKPTVFPEANRTLLKPDGMTHLQCGPLMVYTDETQCVSCWKMSLRERLSALIFGTAWLSVLYGETQPPVALWIAKEGFASANKEQASKGIYISTAREALIESVFSRIRERAERVLEGEKWDLASYVVRTIAELE